MPLHGLAARYTSAIGRGSAWVRRWFAKPFVSGSIPATASKRFPADYTHAELAALAVDHWDKHIASATKATDLQEKLKAISMELSAMKRSKPLPQAEGARH